MVPFLEVVEKMSAFWQERKIDMFKDGISVPGLTLKHLFSFLGEQTYFSVFNQANSDLYHLIRDNNTGGPSIICHRYHEAGKTKIREAEEGQHAKLCQKIVGYDGLSCRTCQRGAIQEGWRKTTSNPKVLYAWQLSGWSG